MKFGSEKSVTLSPNVNTSKPFITHALQAVTTPKSRRYFFRPHYALKTFSPHEHLNLSYSSTLNDCFFLSFSYPLKVTREMTLTDIYLPLLWLRAKQSRDVV